MEEDFLNYNRIREGFGKWNLLLGEYGRNKNLLYGFGKGKGIN